MFKINLSLPKIILFIIVLFSFSIMLGVTGYLLSLKKTSPYIVQPTANPTVTSTPEPTPSKIPSANTSDDWKIFRSNKYGFEFKYKSDWQLEQQNNYIELKPTTNDKPEEISISVNIITDRPKDYTLAGWLLQNGNNNASCNFIKKIDKIEWCGIDSERFEAVRADDYGITKNNIDYDIQFRVAYGRQEMDYYISDKDLSSEINALNQILSTFKFTEE